jgi:exosortase F-associated protein
MPCALLKISCSMILFLIFSKDFTMLGCHILIQHNYFRLFFRYTLNTTISWELFMSFQRCNDGQICLHTVFFFSSLILIVFCVINLLEATICLFYVRRFLIQPILFYYLFRFYYQNKIDSFFL